MKICIVDECYKNARSPKADYCPMHYHRLYRYGTLERKTMQAGGICSVDECIGIVVSIGLCSPHYQLMRHHGTTELLERTGESNPSWLGDSVTYNGMHSRLRINRGRAKDQQCIDCGNRAKHWSYNHNDPQEFSSDEGLYSTDLQCYSPRCVPCHKAFDLRHIGSTSVLT